MSVCLCLCLCLCCVSASASASISVSRVHAFSGVGRRGGGPGAAQRRRMAGVQMWRDKSWAPNQVWAQSLLSQQPVGVSAMRTGGVPRSRRRSRSSSSPSKQRRSVTAVLPAAESRPPTTLSQRRSREVTIVWSTNQPREDPAQSMPASDRRGDPDRNDGKGRGRVRRRDVASKRWFELEMRPEGSRRVSSLPPVPRLPLHGLPRPNTSGISLPPFLPPPSFPASLSLPLSLPPSLSLSLSLSLWLANTSGSTGSSIGAAANATRPVSSSSLSSYSNACLQVSRGGAHPSELTCLSACLPVCLPVSLPVCLPAYLSLACLSVCLSVCLLVCLFVCWFAGCLLTHR